MELKLRLLSEQEPLLKLRFESKTELNPETGEFEGGLEGLERIAARLATDLECRGGAPELVSDHSFEQFQVQQRPQVGEGWWSETFG
jgi:hypothetical protein